MLSHFVPRKCLCTSRFAFTKSHEKANKMTRKKIKQISFQCTLHSVRETERVIKMNGTRKKCNAEWTGQDWLLFVHKYTLFRTHHWHSFLHFFFFLKSNFVFVEFATLLCYCNKRLKKVIFNLNRAIMYTKRNICRKYGR